MRYKYNACPYQGMSLSFNRRGDRLLVIGRRMPPLLYDWLDSSPAHEFSSNGYYCACTIKSCCWSGPNEEVSNKSELVKRVLSTSLPTVLHKSFIILEYLIIGTNHDININGDTLIKIRLLIIIIIIRLLF